MIRKMIWIFLHPIAILAGFLFAVLLFAGCFIYIKQLRHPAITEYPLIPFITVIPAPTATLIPDTPVPIPTATPTLPPPPAPEEGEIFISQFVRISGTGGDRLRLRRDPGLNSDVLFLALENEVFIVQDGPAERDGYTWWYLIAPYDKTLFGWAAANYLVAIQSP